MYSNSCHFRLCVMIFPPWSGFVFRFVFCSCHAFSYHVIMCIAFAYVFVSCIRAFSPLSVFQSGAPISSGASLLFSFVSGCQTFSEWTEAFQVALIYHPETTGQVSFHLEVVWLTGHPQSPFECPAKTPSKTSPKATKLSSMS